MYNLITVLLFITCILLILIVLVQNSKGGGLASNFQSSNQIMGVRKTTDFLEKATWGLAGALLFLSIIAVGFIPRGERPGQESQIQDLIEQTQDPNQVPNFPAPVQEQTPAPSTPAPATAAPDTTK